jgi:uncharacterized membrane protein YphA (DoxX/SURF4 family)
VIVSNFKKHLIFDALAIVARFVLGVVFLYSGIQHVLRPQQFLVAVSAYELASPPVNVFIACVLPWAEAVSGVCLIGGLFLQGAFFIVAILLGTYSVVIGLALARHLQIECGCGLFGINSSIINPTNFATTFSFFGIAIWLYLQAIFSTRKNES